MEDESLSIKEDELIFAQKLLKLGYMTPKKCKCNSDRFTIQYDSNSKTSHCIYRCQNYKCKNRITIRTNSFFEDFPKLTLRAVCEIIKSFLCFEYNAIKAYTYITQNLKETVSLEAIRKVYDKMRKIIYDYYLINYESGYIGLKNMRDSFSIDESLFTHLKSREQVWLLGLINTRTREFRLQPTINRNGSILKKFVTKYIDSGNRIISDGWVCFFAK